MDLRADEEMLALIPPARLVGLGLALRTMLLPAHEEKIDEIAADADLHEEPNSHFKKLLRALEFIEEMDIALDDDAANLIDDARDQMKLAIEAFEERKRERDEETDNDTDWTHTVTQKKKSRPRAKSPPQSVRSSMMSINDDEFPTRAGRAANCRSGQRRSPTPCPFQGLPATCRTAACWCVQESSSSSTGFPLPMKNSNCGSSVGYTIRSSSGSR